jgi:thioredoxin 1
MLFLKIIIPVLKIRIKWDIIIIKTERKFKFMSVIKVDKTNFNDIKNSENRVLLDFYADWCGPCKMVSPIIDEIAEENPQYVVGKINVDEEPELAIEFGVSTIPNLVVLEGGKVINQIAGARPKPAILKMLEE